MHLPKVAGNYFNSLFFKMDTNAILKTKKGEILFKKTIYLSLIAHMIKEMTPLMFCFFKVALHPFWAAIFDIKVKMVSENIKNHNITFLIPELTGNDTSFDFLCHLYQEMPLFLVLNMASVAILVSHLELEVTTDPKFN